MRVVATVLPVAVSAMLGFEIIGEMGRASAVAVTAAGAEATATAVSATVVNLVPAVTALVVGLALLNVFGSILRTEHRVDLPKPNTLQDDIEEAHERYMDDEIAEYRLEREIGDAIEEHDDSEERLSRLDEELMGEETTELLNKMENA